MEEARGLLSNLHGVTTGRAYGHPSFLIAGKFFARFRDDDSVLVLHLENIEDRDVLMSLDPAAFFFTDHYRNYPAVLIRLAEVPRQLLEEVVTQAWWAITAQRGERPTRKTPTKKAGPARPKRSRK